MMNSFRLKKKRQNKQKKATYLLVAARIGVALLLVLTLAMGGACSVLRHGAGKTIHPQNGSLSGTYAARQDTPLGQRPTCCTGCARTVTLPTAILSCPQEESAFEPVKTDPNAVNIASEESFSSGADSNRQPSCQTPFSRPQPFIVNCVLLC